MKMQKALIVTKEDPSSWKSCQHITQNLIQSYQLIFPENGLHYLKVEEGFSYYLAHKYAKLIKKMDVDVIIWLDHKPCAANMQNALAAVFSGTPEEDKPKFIVHLFGDFILNCLEWEGALENLNKYPIHFMVASERQRKIVDKLLVSQHALSSVIPFPVQEKFFSMENHGPHRAEIRDRLNIKSDDLVLIYTGRISFQKNVEAVINTVNKVNSILDQQILLLIAGPWDDILLPYFGNLGMTGSYFTQFKSSITGKNLSHVRFLGDLATDELIKTYHAADAFISFSTFNDEDYGMSVAEALMTGLPCVLSDWGGFASFPQYSADVELIPVKFNEGRMQVDFQSAQKKVLKKIFQILNKETDREKIALDAKAALSTKAMALRLKSTLESIEDCRDIHASPLFLKLCTLFQFASHSPFKNNLSTYKEIYDDYASEKF